MRRFLLCGILVLAPSACTVMTHDDTLQRADDAGWRVVDNAIYEVFAEKFGKERVQLSEYPEKENHRWVAISDQENGGLNRRRVCVEGTPETDRTGHYSPWVVVRNEMYSDGRWIEMGTNTKSEVELLNLIDTKVRAWRGSGSPANVASRRDEFLAKKS